MFLLPTSAIFHGEVDQKAIQNNKIESSTDVIILHTSTLNYTRLYYNTDNAGKLKSPQLFAADARAVLYFNKIHFRVSAGDNQPASIVVRVGNNRPDLGTNPICNRFNGFLEEGKPLFLPCNPPMPGAFVSVHLEASAPAQLSICEAFVYTDQVNTNN